VKMISGMVTTSIALSAALNLAAHVPACA